MLSTLSIFVIGLLFVAVCLLALYIMAIRINNQNNYVPGVSIASGRENRRAEVKAQKLHAKKSGTSTNSCKNNINDEQNTTAKVTSDSNESKSGSIYDEDDIIALAVLKGYDISGIRRKNKSQTKEITNPVPKCVFEPDSYSNSDVIASKYISPLDTTSVELSIKSSMNPANTDDSESKLSIEERSSEWNNVRTREEMTIRSLKAKNDSLQIELKKSSEYQNQSSRNLERMQLRLNLLERESKDQNQAFSSAKIFSEAQITSLKVINREMAAKLATVDAESLNLSLTRTELGRAKEDISRLRIDGENFQEERNELSHQLSEYKKEILELRNKAYLVDTLTDRCKILEESFEESRRELNLQLENYKTELKLTRVKLEGEVAFHRAEHANSVGSSTALHQEIAQLKADLNASSKREADHKLKFDELEKINGQLIFNLEDLRSSENSYQITISTLEEKLNGLNEKIYSLNSDFEKKSADLADIEVKFDDCVSNCAFLKSELNSASAEIALLKSSIEISRSEFQVKEIESDAVSTKISMTSSELTNNSKELETLRDQLAEAGIKITSLQSDLAREIKRADISKKVFEAKLSEFKKDK